jgi:uncharacterized surface protein with fasciclin (FAS1) repeats
MALNKLRQAALAATVVAGSALLAPMANAQQRNCIDVLAGDARFSNILNAILATSVGNTIRNANQITIFAPTNDAVAKVDVGLRNRLFPRDQETGAREGDPVLAPAAIGAHVVTGTYTAAQLRSTGTLTSVSGSPITPSMNGNTMVITGARNNAANVTGDGIACTNGMVYPIDHVLVR